VGPSLLTAVADRVGTPVWVYDVPAVRARYDALDRALAAVPHRIHYAVKANSNLSVLRTLKACGAAVDIVSRGELERVLAAGFAPDDVIFSGVGKRRDELEHACRAGVAVINLESFAELAMLREVAHEVGLRARVGIRVNPDVETDTHPYTRTGERGMKFGVPWDEVLPMASAIRNEALLDLVSVGMHLGSQIADPAPYREGGARLVALVGALRGQGVQSLQHVDVGGGLAVDYGDGTSLSAEAFAGAVVPVARALGLTLITEPGRWLVGPAGVLLTRVQYRKHTGGRDLAIVDAGMNDLLRPSLYGAEHPIWVVRPEGDGAGDEEMMDVVGPLCESGDFLGHQRRLAGVGSGTLLAVGGAGAYGFVMSSQYNSRPRGAEVVVDGDRWAVAREREPVQDLWRGEPAELAWHESS